MAEEESDDVVADKATETDAPGVEGAQASSTAKNLLAKVPAAKLLNGVKGVVAQPDTRRFLAGAVVGALVLYAGGTVFSGSDAGNGSKAETKVEALRADLAELRADLAILQATGGAAEPAPAAGGHDEVATTAPETTMGHVSPNDGAEPEPSSDHEPDPSVGHEPAATSDEPPHWTYGESADWGSLADAYIECAEGTEQSPVDLSTTWDRVDSTTELGYESVPVSVVDNGHTIQVGAEGAGSVSQENHDYELAQFHFHAPSEHTIDGEHFAAEVHLVHKDADDKLAVVGIMIEQGAPLAGFDAILDAIGDVDVEHDAGEFDPSVLLPTTKDFFHYRGSLTTPPCTEGVAWRVMAEPITMSAAQLDELTSHFAEANNRPVQPRNDRDAHVDMA